MTTILAAILFGLTPVPCSFAASKDLNIQGLLADCRAEQGSADFAFCLGYVGGFSDLMVVNAIMATKAGVPKPPVSMCVTNPGPTYGARIQAFVNWARQNPKTWSEQNFVGVAGAMAATWPCT
jgi:hypothetical protein